MKDEDYVECPGLGSSVALMVRGRTLVQREYYGKEENFRITHVEKIFFKNTAQIVQRTVDKDLVSGEVQYVHTVCDGTVEASLLQDYKADDMAAWKAYTASIFCLEVRSAFGLHCAPFGAGDVNAKLPVLYQDGLVYYGVQPEGKMVCPNAYMGSHQAVKFDVAEAMLYPRSGEVLRTGDTVTVNKHSQKPRILVRNEDHPEDLDAGWSLEIDDGPESVLPVPTPIDPPCMNSSQFYTFASPSPSSCIPLAAPTLI